MRYADTIIVGGGPAGSTCARALKRAGHDVLVLDKAAFPRLKLCAGWITAKAMRDLEFTPADYPHPILRLDIRSHLPRLPFALTWFPTPGDNWSIRRVEFDDWLLGRSGAPVLVHEARTIRREGGRYVIDEQFACRRLVGAGGTKCPVRRSFFPDALRKDRQIVTLEKEFEYPRRDDLCHLYFFHRGINGYGWLVPKGDGFVNVGLGARAGHLKAAGENIHARFRTFLGDLAAAGKLDAETAAGLEATGHPYHLFAHGGEVKRDNCYIIGDAAGLATVDLGEGIGPAVESGLMAAADILGTGRYDKDAVSIHSFGGVLRRLLERRNRRRVIAAG